jgi:SAM-dependent methyltransferase
MTAEARPCPLCESGRLDPFLRIDEIPVMTTELWDDAGAAIAAPRGDLVLAICDRCAAIRNIAFDPDVVEYTGDYENSQLFSGAFHAYAEELARRLVDEFDLESGTVVELGAGKGEFLQMLCDAGCRRAIGFDPSYQGEVDDGPLADRIVMHRRLFRADDNVAADLAVSRHVLEHLDEPLDVLRTIREGLGPSGGALYVEVPDARYVLTEEGMWDLIYPHVTYFGPVALKHLLARAGFGSIRCRRAFGEQFLSAIALPAADDDSLVIDAVAVADARAAAHRFAERFEQMTAGWRALLDKGDRTALWGAGAKGVTFLNALASGGGIDAVVDINPRKQGRFLPGTGHQVIEPEALRAFQPERVILMNPMYQAEVGRALAELDVRAEVVVA